MNVREVSPLSKERIGSKYLSIVIPKINECREFFSLAQWDATHILSCCAKRFLMSYLWVVGLDPLNLLPAPHIYIRQKWRFHSSRSCFYFILFYFIEIFKRLTTQSITLWIGCMQKGPAASSLGLQKENDSNVTVIGQMKSQRDCQVIKTHHDWWQSFPHDLMLVSASQHCCFWKRRPAPSCTLEEQRWGSGRLAITRRWGWISFLLFLFIFFKIDC